MKVYISGPMRGYPKFNYPAFNDADEWLIFHGYTPLNPVTINADLDGTDASFADYMRRDIAAVAEADAIFLLSGWRDSVGANVELITAISLGLRLGYYYPDLVPVLFSTEYPQPNYALLGRELRNKQEVPA